MVQVHQYLMIVISLQDIHSIRLMEYIQQVEHMQQQSMAIHSSIVALQPKMV